ncbi:very short patch repair endonuclease [Paenibacillus nanensis]|nr:very short patch repair endonuclease [Paenibacillus nanensis]
MSNIRSISKIEILVAKELWKKGARFRRNTKALMGNPDISIQKYKLH